MKRRCGKLEQKEWLGNPKPNPRRLPRRRCWLTQILQRSCSAKFPAAAAAAVIVVAADAAGVVVGGGAPDAVKL